MSTKFTVDGLSDLDKALGDLGKSLGRGVLRRVAVSSLQDMASQARSAAPNDPGTSESIAETIIVTTKRPKGEKSAAQRAFAQARAAGLDAGQARSAAKAATGGETEVSAFMGPNRDPKAVQQEFGNSRHGAQPFMRPAWDAKKGPVVDQIGSDLWREINKAAARAASRAAKLASKG